MKNKWMKFGLVFGFVSLIVGLALGAIGLSNKGLEQLTAATKPKEVHQTFDAVETIDVNLWGRNVFIEPTSPDDKVHVTYKDFEVSLEDLDISVSDKTLYIRLIEHDYTINASPLTIIGEELNRGNGPATFDEEQNAYLGDEIVIIQVPENTKSINLVNGIAIGRQIHVQDLTIQQLTGNTGLVLNNVTVENAELTGNWYLNASNSHLKNLSVTGDYQGGVDLYRTSLENASFTSDNSFSGNIFAEDLTIIGNVDIDITDGRIDLKLAEASKTNIDFDIELEKLEDRPFAYVEIEDDGVYYYDENDELIFQTDSPSDNPNLLTISDSIAKDAQTKDELTFKKTVKDAKGKLTIKGTGPNHITIK